MPVFCCFWVNKGKATVGVKLAPLPLRLELIILNINDSHIFSLFLLRGWNYVGYFSWLMKWKTGSNAMNQSKALEIMWVNVKIPEKRREKGFMKEVKTIQARTTLHLPTLSALSMTSSLNNSTTQIILATQAFCDNQTPSISLINITKTTMK